MSLLASTIGAVTVDGGVVSIKFVGSKVGHQYSSLAELKAAVARARENEQETELLLALAEHLDVDTTLSTPELLAGKAFYDSERVLGVTAATFTSFDK